MTLELPAWLLADRLAVLLVVTCAVVIEAVLLRHPGGVVGPGLLVGAALASWQWSRLKAGRRLRTLTLAADGQWRLQYGDGRTVTAQLARGSRLLGSTVALKWRGLGVPRAVWLTPADLSRTALRGLHVRLSAADQRAGM